MRTRIAAAEMGCAPGGEVKIWVGWEDVSSRDWPELGFGGGMHMRSIPLSLVLGFVIC